jgi:hypothetical protein
LVSLDLEDCFTLNPGTPKIRRHGTDALPELRPDCPD